MNQQAFFEELREEVKRNEDDLAVQDRLLKEVGKALCDKRKVIDLTTEVVDLTGEDDLESVAAKKPRVEEEVVQFPVANAQAHANYNPIHADRGFVLGELEDCFVTIGPLFEVLFNQWKDCHEEDAEAAAEEIKRCLIVLCKNVLRYVVKDKTPARCRELIEFLESVDTFDASWDSSDDETLVEEKM